MGKSYSSAKEAIIMTGNFLLEQLQMLDNAAGGKATFAFGATAFATSLITEVSISQDRAASDTKVALPLTMSWRHQSAALDYPVQCMLSLTMYKLSSTAYCIPCGTLVSLSVNLSIV